VYSNSDDNPSCSTAAAAASTKLSAASLSMAMHTGLAGQQGSTAASSAAAAAGGSVGPGGRCRAGVPVDVLSHGISYPQFVEVLLCMMAGRATALLEPEVKQLRPLTMDEEMQVGVNLQLTRHLVVFWCWLLGKEAGGKVGAVACHGCCLWRCCCA
jgi:hypothetical protein